MKVYVYMHMYIIMPFMLAGMIVVARTMQLCYGGVGDDCSRINHNANTISNIYTLVIRQ